VLGVLGLAAFVVCELRTPWASLDVRLFRNRQFASASAMIALLFFATMGLFFFITFYIQLVRGRTPLETGLMFLAFGGGMLVFGPLSNSFVQRIGARALGLTALGISAVVFLAIAQFTVTTPLWVLVVLLFLQSMGIANLMPPTMTTLISSVPRERAGVASALGNTLRQVGGALGVAVLGTVVAQTYQHRVAETVPGLPEAARASVTATYGALGHLDPAAAAHAAAGADAAFVDAMQVTAYVAAAIVALGMVVVARYYPGRQRVQTPVGGTEAADEVAGPEGKVAVPAAER
ncbi:MAG: MFS transporter, partial [Nocardioides sp.]|nr:MFS transporter [Nocardioides sp.]